APAAGSNLLVDAGLDVERDGAGGRKARDLVDGELSRPRDAERRGRDQTLRILRIRRVWPGDAVGEARHDRLPLAYDPGPARAGRVAGDRRVAVAAGLAETPLHVLTDHGGPGGIRRIRDHPHAGVAAARRPASGRAARVVLGIHYAAVLLGARLRAAGARRHRRRGVRSQRDRERRRPRAPRPLRAVVRELVDSRRLRVRHVDAAVRCARLPAVRSVVTGAVLAAWADLVGRGHEDLGLEVDDAVLHDARVEVEGPADRSVEIVLHAHGDAARDERQRRPEGHPVDRARPGWPCRLADRVRRLVTLGEAVLQL